MMEAKDTFADYDDEQVYVGSQTRALREETRNFAVEFGKDGARVAFDLQQEDVQSLFDTPAPAERPVRWINIWGPHKQINIVNLLGKQYKFSPRLLAIIHSSPPEPEHREVEKHGIRSRAKAYLKDDVEVGTHSMDSTQSRRQSQVYDSTSHYSLARQMINYQSVDIGAHFLCIGANWMYEQSSDSDEQGIVTEGKQQRLWSWLVLCDDNTVITFREHPGQIGTIEDLKSMRSNTLSIFSQLSKIGHSHADPISMQTIRQVLDMDSPRGDPGREGASNLFFYLFDDWRAVYSTVATFHQKLDSLQNEVFDDMNRRSHSPPKMNIIRSLHILGRQLRESQGLYNGYQNLIRRILEPRNSIHFGIAATRTVSGLAADHRRVTLAQSAAQRFERLGDRIELLILSEIREFLAEKDALISTYFNINAQKDSEQNARLTRSATLLAKLSVLFLPVSLLTGYFSIQVVDLEGVYTLKDYWYAFAVLICISFAFLFFFARLLMWVSEALDARVKLISLGCRAWFRKRLRKDKQENEKQ